MAFLGGNPLIWRLGFAIAWLVGSWLFGPKQKKNDIFDPGAEEMPRWNTALRGITIPILFGTNRVSSQVIWEHDYTVVRNEGDDGGGKMGGSGGGKGGATQEGISYDYYWDFIFHIGMTHQILGLSKVWLGSERISSEGVAAISGSTSGTIIAGEDDEDTEEDERTKMKFEDSIFYSGSGPALGASDLSADYNAWSEITSDMGLGVRWPHTCYVGFKQLHLGQFPGVPQFSFEIGPGGGTIDYNVDMLLSTANVTNERGPIGPTFTFRGDDNVLYGIAAPVQVATTNYLYKYSAGAWTLHDTITDAEIQALFFTLGFADWGSGCVIGVLDPTNYLFVSANVASGTTRNYGGLLKINSSGVLVAVGGASFEYVYLGQDADNPKYISIANNRTLDDPIILIYEGSFGADNAPFMLRFPSINQLLNNVLVYNTTVTGINTINLDATLGDNFGDHGTYRNFCFFWWSLPKLSTSLLLTATFRTLMFFYIGKADTQAHINNDGTQNTYIDSKVGTYPNGFVAYMDFGIMAFSETVQLTEPAITINNSMGAGPFSDLATYDDGVTTHTNAFSDYDPHPYVHKITSGINAGQYIVIFAQQLQDHSVDQLLTRSSLIRGRLLVWDGFNLTYTLRTSIEFVPFDRTLDLGHSDATLFQPYCTFLDWDESSNILNYYAGVTGGDASASMDYDIIGQVGEIDIAGGNDVTPPEIIYQILTSSIFGIGITASQIDQASYDASVTYCIDQQFKISYQCRREEGVLSIIDDLLSCYGGFLVIANGIIYFRQLKYLNGAAASVRTIDNHHLISDERGKPPVQITKGARQDTFNKVKVNYFDRLLEYAQNQVEEGDEVDQDLNGIRAREFPALFVMNEKMARTMAVRALWANLYSRDTYMFKVGWKDHDLAPGDCITLVDSYHNALQSGVVARIIEWKEQKRGEFEVTAKQEFEYIQAASASALDITSESVVNRLGGIPIIRDFTMYELPSEYQMSGAGMAYVSWATHRFARGANLWMSTDGTTYAKVQNREPYQISGVLLSGLPAAYDGDFNENVEMLLSPRTAWTSNSPDYYFNQTLPSADQAGRSVGASLLWCGSEMMAYQGVTLIAQNRYRFTKLFRGWGGTNIHSHNSGDSLYKHGGGVFYQEINEDKIGTKVSYKVQPYNLSGHYQEISSITAKSYTIVGRHYTPQIPPSLRLIWPDDQRSKTTHFVNSTIDIPIQWEQTALKSGYGSKGYGALGYGNFSPDSQAFRVQVYGSGGFVVRSTSVSSPDFTYTSSMNASDNGAWRGNVAFKVTPYNQYGDALKTSVISLELW